MKTLQNLTIRKANNRDASFICNLIFNIWINEYHFDVKREDFPDLQEIEKYYLQTGGLFLVAVIENTIVGTIACDQLNAKKFVLKRMFVHKDYRGLGIAQALLDELFKEMVFAKQNHKPSFFLSTKENQALVAKKFYLKNGFRIISPAELPQGFPFFYQDDLFMVKDQWE